MVKLYPPTIGSSIPAFCKTNSSVVITIPFTMNRAVSKSLIKRFALKVKTAQSNSFIVSASSDENTVTNDIDNGSVTFAFETQKIKVGLFYKFQLAYVSTDNITGYFSTVAIGKCTVEPLAIFIKEYETYPNRTLNYNKQYTGVYLLNALDKGERPYSYKFTLYNKYMEVEETSGWKPHNSTLDDDLENTIDTYTFGKSLAEAEFYYIDYSVRTINDLVRTTPRYTCAALTINDTRINDVKLLATNVFEEGYINLELQKVNAADNWNNTITPMSVIIERSDSSSNFTSWVVIEKRYFSRKSAMEDYGKFLDKTVEQGVTYHYRFGLYDEYGNLSSLKIAVDENDNTDIFCDFEDMFLSDGNQQIKIRFNPKVSSFKETVLESKVDTIGSKYPYVFRNKTVRYKEFPIGGLISYLADNNDMFLLSSEYGIEKATHLKYYNLVRYTNISLAEAENMFDDYADILFYDNDGIKTPLTQAILEDTENEYIFYKQEESPLAYSYRSGTPESTDNVPTRLATTLPLGYNIRAEREFKMRLLEWLNNGEVKLFRSPAEGSFLVRLMNISLTPEDRLGRMIHSFLGLAYEIDELNYDNLVKYGFLDTAEKELVTFSEIRLDDLTDTIINVLSDDSITYAKCNSSDMWDDVRFEIAQDSLSNSGGSLGIYFRLGQDIENKFLIPFGSTTTITMNIADDHAAIPDIYFYKEDNELLNAGSFLDATNLMVYKQRILLVLSGPVEDESHRTVLGVYGGVRSYNIYGLALPSASNPPQDCLFDSANTSLTSTSNGITTISQLMKLLSVEFRSRVERTGYTYSENVLSYNGNVISSADYDRTIIYVTDELHPLKYIVNHENTLVNITDFDNDSIIVNGEVLLAPPMGLTRLEYTSINLALAPHYYCTIILQDKITEYSQGE